MPDLLENALWVLLGALGTMVMAYFALIQKVSKIDGKLEMILEVVRQGNSNTEDIGKVKVVVRKVVKDLNESYRRIKVIEQVIAEDPPRTAA